MGASGSYFHALMAALSGRSTGWSFLTVLVAQVYYIITRLQDELPWMRLELSKYQKHMTRGFEQLLCQRLAQGECTITAAEFHASLMAKYSNPPTFPTEEPEVPGSVREQAPSSLDKLNAVDASAQTLMDELWEHSLRPPPAAASHAVSGCNVCQRRRKPPSVAIAGADAYQRETDEANWSLYIHLPSAPHDETSSDEGEEPAEQEEGPTEQEE